MLTRADCEFGLLLQAHQRQVGRQVLRHRVVPGLAVVGEALRFGHRAHDDDVVLQSSAAFTELMSALG
jgi:hypothetical protein